MYYIETDILVLGCQQTSTHDTFPLTRTVLTRTPSLLEY